MARYLCQAKNRLAEIRLRLVENSLLTKYSFALQENQPQMCRVDWIIEIA